MRPRLAVKADRPVVGSTNRRLNLWYWLLVAIAVIFMGRLFYLQVVKGDLYRRQALAGQLKQYTIAAPRGVISAHDGGKLVPIVLNQTLYTLYADPVYIKDPKATAQKVAAITGGDSAEYARAMSKSGSRYVVLAKKINDDQKNKIAELKIAGVGSQAQDYRVYPQGSLAAQLLGFVNDEGKGTYGLEQALNQELAGAPGALKAITDAAGVPLAASSENTQVPARPGSQVVLTLDAAMQKQLENLLKEGLDKARSASGSALIMDPNSGAIKAMANWPSYDPAQYSSVSDAHLFTNPAVSSPLEVGSIMKILTTSAALNMGVINPDTSYDDPAHWDVDGHTITNIEEDGGPGRHTIAEVLNLSINTGATWMLMQMGGGQLNQKGRVAWHDYLVNHFRLGKSTGIEQGYESPGVVPDPNDGYALNLTYANTAFGQAITATPLQMAAALSSVLNGGTYYRPHLVDKIIEPSGRETVKKPEAVRQNVVSSTVSSQIKPLMEYVAANHHLQPPFSDNYSVGGKTGTAQIASPAGGYYTDRFNGTYYGFAGGDKPQYVVFVRVNEPHIGGYAGSGAAQPIFTAIGHMLINNFNVAPKGSTP